MLWWALLGAGIALCIAAAGLLMRRAAQDEAQTGLPLAHTQVVYSDSGAWEKMPRNLKSEEFGLIGKPDYVLRTAAGIVPVEVKPLRRASQPYASDILQLAAYCLLLEEETGIAPRYGLLRYASQTFKIAWDEPLRQELLQTLDEMRDLQEWPALLNGQMPPPQHDMTVRCDSCGFHQLCWPEDTTF